MVVKTATIEFKKGEKPKWTRKAALGNSPVDCCNRRGFPAGKRVLGPPLLITLKTVNSTIWGVSSAGRAPALQAGGHRFDPGTLHHFKKLTEIPQQRGFIEFLEAQLCTLKTEHCNY